MEPQLRLHSRAGIVTDMEHWMGRRGMAIVVVLSIVVLLAAFAGLVSLLSSSAHREVDVLNGYLRAVGVGECAFAELFSRLSSIPWCRRWFRQAPDVQRDLAIADGTYGYLLRDTPSSSPSTRGFPDAKRADLLIRSTWHNSTVVMFWRLTFPEDSLEGVRRIVPELFTFTSDSIPTKPEAQDPLVTRVDEIVRQRQTNDARTRPIADQVRTGASPSVIAGALGIDPERSILDPEETAENPGQPPDVPDTLETPAESSDNAAQVALSYNSDPPFQPSKRVAGESLSGGEVRYPICTRLTAHNDQKLHADVVLPNPEEIESASIEIDAFNGDSAYERVVSFNVDGQGGYLGTQGTGSDQFVGRGRLRSLETKAWTYDLASLQVGTLPTNDTQTSRTVSVLDLIKKPGGSRLTCYVTTSAALGGTSWVTVNLRVRRRNP